MFVFIVVDLLCLIVLLDLHIWGNTPRLGCLAYLFSLGVDCGLVVVLFEFGVWSVSCLFWGWLVMVVWVGICCYILGVCCWFVLFCVLV